MLSCHNPGWLPDQFVADLLADSAALLDQLQTEPLRAPGSGTLALFDPTQVAPSREKGREGELIKQSMTATKAWYRNDGHNYAVRSGPKGFGLKQENRLRKSHTQPGMVQVSQPN
jgi:hypothetical protein